jgi:hypothetical protein
MRLLTSQISTSASGEKDSAMAMVSNITIQAAESKKDNGAEMNLLLDK